MRFFYYFYAWVPFVVLGTVVVLVLPWLAVVALAAVLVAVVAALGSLAWAVVAALSGLGHSIFGYSRKEPVPIGVYEHPYISDAWQTSGTARRDAGR